MKITFVLKFCILLVSFHFQINAFALDYTQWNLPEGATARLGKGKINEIAYSPDGNRLAVATDIGIWLYDAHTGAEVALLSGHTSKITSVAFSPDRATIASGSDDGVRFVSGDYYYGGTIRLWDVTGTLKKTLSGHTSEVTSVAFSPDGATIVSGDYYGTIRLWDVTGTLKKTLDHGYRVTSVAFSPDGATIASGGIEDTIGTSAITGALQLWRCHRKTQKNSQRAYKAGQ